MSALFQSFTAPNLGGNHGICSSYHLSICSLEKKLVWSAAKMMPQEGLHTCPTLLPLPWERRMRILIKSHLIVESLHMAVSVKPIFLCWPYQEGIDSHTERSPFCMSHVVSNSTILQKAHVSRSRIKRDNL